MKENANSSPVAIKSGAYASDAQLHHSDERFRLIVENVKDYGIFTLDVEGHIDTWNAGARQITGYDAHEVLGRHFSIFYTPEDLRAGKPARELEIATRTGKYEEQGLRVRKDGSLFWSYVVITVLRDPEGHVRGFGKVTRDLTAERAAADELRRSEERYRLLVNSVKDYAIFILDVNGYIQTWNLGAELLKGYRADEIIGQRFTRFYSEEDVRRGHPEAELAIAKAVGRYEEEGWRIRKDGSRFWANVVINRLNDTSGKHIGFAKVTRDLSERRQAELALRESEERFRLMVESVKDYAIIMLNPSGHITSWNEGARRLKGYEAAEILGRHFSAFYEPEEIAVGKCEYELSEATATGRFEDEGWRVRKDGTKFWANVVITALRDSTGTLRGFSKVTRDMTERKRSEDKLKMAHESLEIRVAERTRELRAAVESRDEFLSIASHELRTPLTALKLQNQLVERQIRKGGEAPISSEKIKELTDMTNRQIAQLSRLVEDMLDVSRISSGRLRLEIDHCDYSKLVSQTYESFAAQFHTAGIKTSLDVEAGILVECDSQRIEQVISNFLSNAIKYGNSSPVHVSLVRNGRNAEVRVRDEGLGISEGDQQRIFDRYERAVSASEVSGLGLGLFISRQIAETHGGGVSVESELGKGSTFILTLPLKG